MFALQEWNVKCFIYASSLFFSTIRASNGRLMPSKNIHIKHIFHLSVYSVYTHLSTCVCYRLSVVGNDLCEQQPTPPSGSVKKFWMNQWNRLGILMEKYAQLHLCYATFGQRPTKPMKTVTSVTLLLNAVVVRAQLLARHPRSRQRVTDPLLNMTGGNTAFCWHHRWCLTCY